jgi:predicted short-subunit dehydrogenase-like oxidoreductase (DUF2520 family)
MKTTLTHFALIGSGRMATHLRHYLLALGLPVKCWSRSFAEAPLSQVLAGASHALIAVKDGAIQEVLQQVIAESETASEKIPLCVHFSGAQTFSKAVGAHPLMTFGPDLMSLEEYRQIPFILDSKIHLNQVLPGLPNPSLSIAPADKQIYHALCSLAGNGGFLLFREIARAFAVQTGLPAQVLKPYLKQMIDNFIDHPDTGLTGPLVRGDWQTVQGHLTAVASSPQINIFYKQYLRLAANSGIEIPQEFL